MLFCGLGNNIRSQWKGFTEQVTKFLAVWYYYYFVLLLPPQQSALHHRHKNTSCTIIHKVIIIIYPTALKNWKGKNITSIWRKQYCTTSDDECVSCWSKVISLPIFHSMRSQCRFHKTKQNKTKSDIEFTCWCSDDIEFTYWCRVQGKGEWL